MKAYPVLIKIIIPLLLCTACQKKKTIDVDGNFCGRVFIMATLDSGKIVKEIKTDSLGVAYVPKNFFKEQNNRVRVLKSGQDITDKCKLFSEGSFQTRKIYPKSVEYGSFYVPCKNEVGLSEEYWRQRLSSEGLNNFIDSLVDKNIIRVH